jgi:type II secretory pathway component GspD/PulD (secretin)
MRPLALSLILLCATAWPQSVQQVPPPGTPLVPLPSKAELKSAEKEFKRGVKLKEKGHTSRAFEHFKRAAELDPRNINYITAREITRQTVVYQDIERGNNAMLADNRVQAMAAFREALELDPQNTFAQQRLRDSLLALPQIKAGPVKTDPYAAAAEIMLRPQTVKKSFKYRGDSRELLNQVATAFGLTPAIDDSVVSRNVRFEVQDVDWATAADIISQLTKTFRVPLSAKQVLFVTDNAQNRRQFERMGLRTFYLPDAATPQELNDVANTLRILFDIRYMTQQPTTSSIVVRAPEPVLDAATQFVEGLSMTRPQVMLDIKVFEVSFTTNRAFGTQLPNDFTAYNVPTVVQQALGNQSVQSIIDQLISSGAINQANSTAIAALIAGALNQGSGSLFSNPFIIFGGGLTLTAIPIPPATFTFSNNTSSIRSLEHVTLRASHGNPANFKIGTRYPIVNATFAPIYNTSQISQVLKNQSYIAPVPSFTYEDLGLSLKATPQVRQSDVLLDLEFQIRALGTTSINGEPIITNREYKGVISAPNGESVVISGMISRTEQLGLSGLPLLSNMPALDRAFSTETKQHEQQELLLVVTPHVVASSARVPEEIWLPITAPR